ncbi:hypothetical protein PQX77_015824 [Marasmius sp. AFHP31]|nr:hypothetical protein PQX77_015824 [Marasmius sp. AFHP31]
MPHSSPIVSPNTISESHKSSQSNPSSYQYGFNDLAKENLTHVTSYLDPQSLLALGGVNKVLNEHVKDDHTWRRAFLLNFLGVKPEADLDESTGLLLRRSESSWAREYILRCSLRRRWESHRNSTIAYVPVHSQVSDIHLLRTTNLNSPSNTMNTSLLSSSLQYGIVSRSVVFAGKVLKGFLSPSASGTGLGIGNPNTEFAPDVSACTMTSDGGTAKIYWGMRNGEVAFSTSAKTMDTNTRSAAKIVRCSVLDQHEGEVVELAYTNDEGGYVASAAKDGRVKVWDVKTARCVWASEYFVPDYPKTVKIAASKAHQGEFFLVAGMRSGDVMIWTNLRLDSTEPRGTATRIKVPCPVQKDSDPNQAVPDPTITALHLDTHTDPQSVRVIVSYDGQSEFYRIDVPVATTPSVSITTFKDTNTFIGTITSIYPCLSPSPSRTDESSFIIAGTSMGWVCVYTYPPSSPAVIEPVKKFEAHADGSSITALSWTNTTLITGSSTGSTSVFDAYTFERLRVFGTPVTRPRGGHAPEMQSVRKIVVSGEKDVMVVAVGDRVMGFKADVVKRDKMVKLGKKKTKARTGSHAAVNSKGYNQYALKQLIHESVHEHEKEAEHMKKVYGRERQQRHDLEKLGLDEVEAVEYVLMLSRDEALQREREEQQEREVQALLEEGVFEGDFDFGERAGAGPSRSVPTPPSSSEGSSSNEGSSPPPTVSMNNTPPQRPSKPTYSPYTPPRGTQSSNQKIQVSPRSREEPWEAGWGGEPVARSSGLGGGGGISVSKSWGSVASSISDMELTGRDGGDEFPSMASTSPKVSKSSSFGEGSGRKGAWGGGSPALKAVAGPPSSRQTATQVSSTSSGGQWRVGEDEDEDLKLAIQLSLEEARMRGEAV